MSARPTSRRTRQVGKSADPLHGLGFELPDSVSTRLDAASQWTISPPVNGQHNAA
ncbi:hypothetical protein ACLQ28_30975 [Micromonospora sp. DT201]|uniref:hypothetical protein n=1 Tax=Micromonospora sp. DT201 TaxID=3393442 RepID=UPI003CFA3AB7